MTTGSAVECCEVMVRSALSSWYCEVRGRVDGTRSRELDYWGHSSPSLFKTPTVLGSGGAMSRHGE